MANKSQIKIIHCLKAALRLEDEGYRAVLSGYGARSSTELSFEKARDLVERLECEAVSAGVWTPRKPTKTSTKGVPGKATPNQLSMIAAMWAEVSRQNTAAGRRKALQKFVENRFRVSRVEWLEREDVSKVVRALKAMKEAQLVVEQNGGGLRHA